MRASVAAALALALLVSPAVARADIVTAWVAGKGTARGTGTDLQVQFDGPIAYGLEGGVEVIGIDLFAEALMLTPGEYFFTLNLGFDLSFGEDLVLEAGVFTGPMFFRFAASEAPTGLRTENLTMDEQRALEAAASAAGYASLDALNAEISRLAPQESELNRLAIGWNLVRARVSIEWKLGPLLSIGAVGQAGYHMLLSGEKIAAGAKNEAVDRFATENMFPAEATDLLRRAVGAEKVDKDGLDGVNYDAGAFVKLSF
jgi:hypothetical protein